MNWQEVQGNWEQTKAVLRSYWARLTDADLNAICGNRGRLAAALRVRYGWDPAEAERRLAAFEKDVRYPGAVK
jgi:hypothetical protein